MNRNLGRTQTRKGFRYHKINRRINKPVVCFIVVLMLLVGLLPITSAIASDEDPAGNGTQEIAAIGGSVVAQGDEAQAFQGEEGLALQSEEALALQGEEGLTLQGKDGPTLQGEGNAIALEDSSEVQSGSALSAGDGSSAAMEADVPPVGKAGLTRATITATIDLSAASTNMSGTGYSASGGPWVAYDPRFLNESPVGALTFSTAANGNTYKIIQSGVPNSGVGSPNGKKYGTSNILSISIANNANVTLIISDIHIIGSITIGTSGKLTLLLDQTSYVRGNIRVPSGTTLNIDSYNGNSTSDGLTLPYVATTDLNTNARIGGAGGGGQANGNPAGTITIDGGKITITTRSTGAGIGGGGGFGITSPYYSGASGGSITVNGGDITITQNAFYRTSPNNMVDIGGACIGGGGGSSQNGGSGGNITINGGKLTLTQYSCAAAIGGGLQGPAGTITINDGDLNIVNKAESGRESYAGAGEGSGIGSGTGTFAAGRGNITINGGTINVNSRVTAIGISNASAAGASAIHDITITGGTVYAKGGYGSGIGHWLDAAGGSIKITGGTVVAESDSFPAIGARDGFPNFTLDAGANVRAYSGGNYPAILAKENAGTGFYVNASFASAVSTSDATTMRVFAEDDPGTLLKTLSLPKNYRHFAYSSDQSTSRTDNIFVDNGTNFTHVVSRVKDSSLKIFSVKTRAGYYSVDPSATGSTIYVSLPVKLTNIYTITEKYVDTKGNKLAEDTKAYVLQSSPTYTKTIPSIGKHTAMGYKLTSYTPPTYTAGTSVTINPVSAHTTVYFIYDSLTTLKLSKEVTGISIDETRDFNFDLSFFKDSASLVPASGSFDYYDKDPADPTSTKLGTLTLDGTGKCSVALKHNESVYLADVSDEFYIRIVETPDPQYITTFKDSTKPSPENGNDTAGGNVGARKMSTAREFGFVNELIPTMDFGFYKIDEADTPLANVGFELCSCSKQGQAGHVHDSLVTESSSCCWVQCGTTTSGSDGHVEFSDLSFGEYMLVETNTAPGYQLPAGQWLIDVDGTTGISITAHASNGMLPPSFKYGTGTYAGSLLLPNYHEMIMPQSGGPGLIVLVVFGIILIGSALLYLIVSASRKREPDIPKRSNRQRAHNTRSLQNTCKQESEA